ASVSHTCAISRGRAASDRASRGADSDPLRAKDWHRLGRLALEAFGCSYKTCTRRLQEWTVLGLWQQIHQLFLAKLRGADQLDWSRVLIDCSQVKAPLGGQKQGRIPRIAAAVAASIAC